MCLVSHPRHKIRFGGTTPCVWRTDRRPSWGSWTINRYRLVKQENIADLKNIFESLKRNIQRTCMAPIGAPWRRAGPGWRAPSQTPASSWRCPSGRPWRTCRWSYLGPDIHISTELKHHHLLVLECLLVDGLDDGRGHGAVVARHPVQQRLQPALRRLDVGVQEGQHVSSGRPGASSHGVVRAVNKPSRSFTVPGVGPLSLLKAPTSAFTIKNLLRHYTNQGFKHGK